MNELRDSELTQYQTTCIAFINALLFATENFDERVRLRNEFIGKYFCLNLLQPKNYTLIRKQKHTVRSAYRLVPLPLNILSI